MISFLYVIVKKMKINIHSVLQQPKKVSGHFCHIENWNVHYIWSQNIKTRHFYIKEKFHKHSFQSKHVTK